jgi:hypothetical protein
MRELEPFPADWSVRQALEAYLKENGFTFEGYDAKWTEGSLFGLKVMIPNTRRHRWNIMLHDLHHVVTGYGTDLTGEGEISWYELRRSWWALGLYVGSIVFFAAMAGVVLSPRRMIAAWRDSKDLISLHALMKDEDQKAYEALLDLSVGDLRGLLKANRAGIARLPRSLHTYAPGLISPSS